MGEVGADLADGGGGDILGVIPDREAGGAAADLRAVALAGFVAARIADGGVVLEGVAAVAFLAVFEAGEGVVVGAGGAEGHAGFERHGCR